MDNFSVKMDSGQVVDKIFVPMVCRGIIPSESACMAADFVSAQRFASWDTKLASRLEGVNLVYPSGLRYKL